jgi:hypothetical protein
MQKSHSTNIAIRVAALVLILFTGFFSVSGGLRAYAATQQGAENELQEKLEEKSFLSRAEKGRRLHHKRPRLILLIEQDQAAEVETPFELSAQFVAPSQWFTPPPLLRAPPRSI